jgi:hypothetical protein
MNSYARAVACGIAVLSVLTGLLIIAPTKSEAGSPAERTASGVLSSNYGGGSEGSSALAFPAPAVVSYISLPMSFEANLGQTDARAKFISRGSGYTLFLTDSEAIFALQRPVRTADGDAPQLWKMRVPFRSAPAAQRQESAVVRMKLQGARMPSITGLEELPGKSNYYIGNDPAKWRTNVPTYSKVRYRGIYPGIDLVYYGNRRQLEYDFVVAPGADPKAIQLAFSGVVDGQSKAGRPPYIDAEGDLILRSADGEVRFQKPLVYQAAADGRRIPLEAQYALSRKGDIGFAVARYDPNKPLVIDPVLAYSTFLGGVLGRLDTELRLITSGICTSRELLPHLIFQP